MGAEHLKKLDKLPGGALFGIAAALVFICQLVAMVLVVEGQVQRAHSRQAAQQVKAAADVPASLQARQIEAVQQVSGVSVGALQMHSPSLPFVQFTTVSEKLQPTSFTPR